MKQSLSNALRGFVCGLAAAALSALVIALMLTLYDVPRTVELAALPWAALLLAVALVSELLCARGSNMLVLLAACGALLFFGGEQVVLRTVFLPASHGFPIFLRILVWISGFCCIYAVYKLPSSDLFVRLSDALIIALTADLAACFFLGDPLTASVLAFALPVLCACLTCAALLRAGGENGRVVRGTGAGGLLLAGGVLGVCALGVSALLSLVSGRINSVVDALLAVWGVCVRIIARAFELFARFIALFAPKPVQYNMSAGNDSAFLPEGAGLEVTAAMPRWLVMLLIALIVLAIAAAVLAILWALRGTKLSRAPRRTARRVTRTSRMMEALLNRLRALREALAFESALRRNRRTPQGLYVLAVRRCRLTKLRKRPGESPPAFIRRLHAQLMAQSGMSTLDALAAKLERALYAGERVPLSHGESDAFATQIQAAAKLPAQISKTSRL